MFVLLFLWSLVPVIFFGKVDFRGLAERFIRKVNGVSVVDIGEDVLAVFFSDVFISVVAIFNPRVAVEQADDLFFRHGLVLLLVDVFVGQFKAFTGENDIVCFVAQCVVGAVVDVPGPDLDEALRL